MSIEAELQQYASDLNADLHQKELRLNREKADLEEKLLLVQVSLDVVGSRKERLSSLFNELRGRLVCPSCFIQEEVWAEVIPIPSETDREDLFRCKRCRTEFSVLI